MDTEIRSVVEESFKEVFGNNGSLNLGKADYVSTYLNNYYLALSRDEEWAKALQESMFEEVKAFVEKECK